MDAEGGRAVKVRSGFERDVSRPGAARPVMAGVNDLGEGTLLSFHPQAFKDLGLGTLQKLEVVSFYVVPTWSWHA